MAMKLYASFLLLRIAEHLLQYPGRAGAQKTTFPAIAADVDFQPEDAG
jgi:hypothetical protein